MLSFSAKNRDPSRRNFLTKMQWSACSLGMDLGKLSFNTAVITSVFLAEQSSPLFLLSNGVVKIGVFSGCHCHKFILFTVLW